MEWSKKYHNGAEVDNIEYVLDKGYVKLENWMGKDNTVVSAARVSHLGASKGKEKDDALIRYLMVHNHTSPFEQVEFQFIVKCPIFIARQWMRHRTWSYNEISRRYTSVDIEFHEPRYLRGESSENTQSSEGVVADSTALIGNIKKSTAFALETYNLLIKKGVCREQARMVLPENLYTTFYAKTDLHNLFHFLELRGSKDAQYEMQLYATAIEKLIEPIVPVSYLTWKELKNDKS